jgi:hypothetical protein
MSEYFVVLPVVLVNDQELWLSELLEVRILRLA